MIEKRSVLSGVVFVVNSQLPDTMASFRLSQILPARYLGCRTLYFGAHFSAQAWLDKCNPRIVVLSKNIDGSLPSLAMECRRRGVKVASIFCDYHFEDEGGASNRQIAELSDVCIVQTETMAREIKMHWGLSATIIEECLEYPPMLPKSTLPSTLNILWYGHQSNYPELAIGVDSLIKGEVTNIRLLLVSDVPPTPPVVKSLAHFSGDVFFKPWSIRTQHELMFESDVIFIPSSHSKDKIVKGHNRLTEAINSSRYPVVFPNPQYLELAEWCWCSQEYARGIEFYRDNFQRIRDTRETAVSRIQRRFGIDAIAEKWMRLLVEL